MSADITRMRFSNGLFLFQEDFVTEQEYHRRMRRMHNRHLHGRGIVWGLQITPGEGSLEIVVGEGMALDRVYDETYGEDTSRELVVTESLRLNLADFDYLAGEQVYVWIYYAEEMASIPTGRETTEPIHWNEKISIGHSRIKPTDEDKNIILARIVINAGGSITESDIFSIDENGSNLRQPSGAFSNQLSTETLVLTDPEISESWPKLDAKLFPDGSRGMQVISEKTELTGNLKVNGSFQLDTNLTVSGITTLTGDTVAQQNVNIRGNLDVDVDGNVDGTLTVRDLEVINSAKLKLGAVIDEFSTDPALAGNSDSAVPTEKAVKSYVDQKTAVNASEIQSLKDQRSNQVVPNTIAVRTSNGSLKVANATADNEATTQAQMNAKNFIKEENNSQIYLQRNGDILKWSDTPSGPWRPFA